MACDKGYESILKFLDGALNEEELRGLEEHVEGCPGCRSEFSELKDCVRILEHEAAAISVPAGFMGNVRTKVAAAHMSRKKTLKANALLGAAAAMFLTFFVGTAMANGGFATMADWWENLTVQEDEQLKGIVENGLGEELNLSAESSGFRVKIKSVAADDTQTLVYYEVENTVGPSKYMIDFSEGLNIKNREKNWDLEGGTPLRSQLNLFSDEEGVYRGRLALEPLKNANGKINVTVGKLERVVSEPGKPAEKGAELNEAEHIEGSWSFEIPVKKHPSIEHTVNVETTIKGIPVVFEKLTIAPTGTLLTYRYKSGDSLLDIKIDSIEANGKLAKPEILGAETSSSGETPGWTTKQVAFASLYFEKVKSVKIKPGSLHYFIKDEKKIDLAENTQLPFTFKYKNNSITIEKMDVGIRTRIFMTEELQANRPYEILQYEFFAKDQKLGSGSMIDGYFIDKHGEKFEASDYMLRTDELDEPRLFSTQHTIELSGAGNTIMPDALVIEGYTKTEFVDRDVTIPLK
ncbi:DUF4179 domain-containing protein [Bacillus sp. FJAT-27245]|uniref:DUF4179 domain-containing protein n=1 Tax=Bacillus sp. FJAT-27245 TaxID=1684144 RepID=UPI0018D069F8|nr:DUF4179 domain-containing protein [Bacillus sp. FJAT-27245]